MLDLYMNLLVYSHMINEEKMNNIEFDFYTNTYYNFGRHKTVTWKTDDVIDKLIYKELKKRTK